MHRPGLSRWLWAGVLPEVGEHLRGAVAARLDGGAKLPEPVFTPTTKAAAGHDEPLTYAETVSLVDDEMAAELERITLEIYWRGAALAAERGVLIADTKLEFGRAADGSLMLADEVLTSDS